MYSTKRIFGNDGEEIAYEYLRKEKYEIIERNFICRLGEIDIIAKENDEYVFIEVKTRRNKNYGEARDAVDEYKQKHIYRTARYYLHIHRLDNTFVRFDVIEVYLLKEKYKVIHLKQVEFKQ